MDCWSRRTRPPLCHGVGLRMAHMHPWWQQRPWETTTTSTTKTHIDSVGRDYNTHTHSWIANLQYIFTYYIKVISLYLQTLWKVNSQFFFLNFVSFLFKLIQTLTMYLCDFIFKQYKTRALFTSSIHVQPFHFWKASKHLCPIYITQPFFYKWST